MTHTTIRVAMTALVTLTVAAPCEAQRASERAVPPAHDAKAVSADHRPTGFMLGVRSIASPGLSLPMEVGNDGQYQTTFGVGAGTIIGYGINETFSVYTSLDVAKQKAGPDEAIQGSWGLVDLALGARANLPLGGARTIPYVNAAYGRRALAARAIDEENASFDASISGNAFTVGGGVEHAFSRTMSLDAGVDMGFGKFNHLKADDNEVTQNVGSTRSLRMRLGVNWHPGSRSRT